MIHKQESLEALLAKIVPKNVFNTGANQLTADYFSQTKKTCISRLKKKVYSNCGGLMENMYFPCSNYDFDS